MSGCRPPAQIETLHKKYLQSCDIWGNKLVLDDFFPTLWTTLSSHNRMPLFPPTGERPSYRTTKEYKLLPTERLLRTWTSGCSLCLLAFVGLRIPYFLYEYSGKRCAHICLACVEAAVDILVRSASRRASFPQSCLGCPELRSAEGGSSLRFHPEC